jgi:hypothetical protein
MQCKEDFKENYNAIEGLDSDTCQKSHFYNKILYVKDLHQGDGDRYFSGER